MPVLMMYRKRFIQEIFSGEIKLKNKSVKVCFAASSGGHFEQLMMLKPLMEKYDSFVITENTKYNTLKKGRIYYVHQVNRKEIAFVFLMIMNTFKSLKIFFKEKPDVVICTGVLAMIPMCLISKLFGKKLIYIESFAKIKSPTVTGKFLYKFADKFYVQWESMLEFYPEAKYIGGIY